MLSLADKQSSQIFKFLSHAKSLLLLFILSPQKGWTAYWLGKWAQKEAATIPSYEDNQDDSRLHLVRKPSYQAASIQFFVCPFR
jgi:hypothetical protein